MLFDSAVRALSLCLVLACAETLHGIWRAAFLVPRIGKARALKVSIFSGAVLAFVVCYLLVPKIGLETLAEHLWLGVGLALFMAAFDLALGRWLLKRGWRKALGDFNPATGNYLVFGLLLLVFIPALVAVLRSSL